MNPKTDQDPVFKFSKIKYEFWLLLIGCGIISSIGIWQFFLPFLAERHFREGYNINIRSEHYLSQRRGNALRQFQYAAEELQTAVKYAPWETHYQIQLGKVYEKMAEILRPNQKKEKIFFLKKAENLYQNMLQLDDQNPWYQNRLAVINQVYATLFEKEKDLYNQKAENFILLSAQLDPNNPLFQMNAAYFYHKAGRYNDAIPYYQRALEIDDRMFEAAYNLAEIHIRQQQLDKALALYQSIYDQKPNFQATRLSLGRLLFNLGKYSDSVRILQEEVMAKPNNALAKKTLNQILFELKKRSPSN